MIVELKSGEVELKLTHRAIYKLKKDTGRDIMEFAREMGKGDVNITDVYDIMFAALSYKTIEDLLDDLKEDKVEQYIEAVGDALGKLLGAKK